MYPYKVAKFKRGHLIDFEMLGQDYIRSLLIETIFTQGPVMIERSGVTGDFTKFLESHNCKAQRSRARWNICLQKATRILKSGEDYYCIAIVWRDTVGYLKMLEGDRANILTVTEVKKGHVFFELKEEAVV